MSRQQRMTVKDSKALGEIVRVQIEMPVSKLEELDRIRELAGMRTRKELFDNALTLFARAVAEGQLGHRIAFLDEEGDRYLVLAMPALDAVFRQKRQEIR
jgi:hypothetical protein